MKHGLGFNHDIQLLVVRLIPNYNTKIIIQSVNSLTIWYLIIIHNIMQQVSFTPFLTCLDPYDHEDATDFHFSIYNDRALVLRYVNNNYSSSPIYVFRKSYSSLMHPSMSCAALLLLIQQQPQHKCTCSH